MMQYRITVNGSMGAVLDAYPGKQWARAAEVCESRGLPATFERRLVTDRAILEMVGDAPGYTRLGDRVLCPWEILAEIREAVG